MGKRGLNILTGSKAVIEDTLSKGRGSTGCWGRLRVYMIVSISNIGDLEVLWRWAPSIWPGLSHAAYAIHNSSTDIKPETFIIAVTIGKGVQYILGVPHLFYLCKVLGDFLNEQGTLTRTSGAWSVMVAWLGSMFHEGLLPSSPRHGFFQILFFWHHLFVERRCTL